MSFGEKLRTLRKASGLSQAELARRLGITERSIHNYEGNYRYPKGRDVLVGMAEIFGVSVDYLLDEDPFNGESAPKGDEAFLEQAAAAFGSRGRREAEELVARTGAMFAGGALSEADKDAFFQSITQAYFEAKEAARRKYGRGAKD